MPKSREHIEDSIDLWAAVANLPPKYKAVLLMRALGLTQEEIAELLGRSQPYVNGILKNARVLIKQL